MEQMYGKIIAAFIGGLVTLGGAVLTFIIRKKENSTDLSRLKAEISKDLWERVQIELDKRDEIISVQREYICELEKKLRECRKSPEPPDFPSL